MKINVLEKKIENIEDTDFLPIIELIINSVRDYPVYGLDDTEVYFNEIRKLLKADNITSDIISEYLQQNTGKERLNHMWVINSLNSLMEAFNLMKLYQISFEKIQNKINELN